MIKNVLTELVYWKSLRSVIPGPKKRRTSGRMAIRDRYADIKTRLSTESPIIIDGGANNGSTTDFLLRQYRSPVVHTFEAIPELVDTLKQKYVNCRNVTVYGVAMGDEEKIVSFNIVNNLVSSSVLKPSVLNRKIHGEKMDVCRVVEVQQIRLEDTMRDVHEIDLLKLDLQGYELEALKGCGSLLERIKIITVEVEFVSLYEDQPLFGDIDVFLRSKGYRLLNLYELYTQEDGQLTAGDAVYLNSNYF